MSARSKSKEARHYEHSTMMRAFYKFLDGYGADRPIEGERRFGDMLDAFKAGWKAA